jgi:hypothetical protein
MAPATAAVIPDQEGTFSMGSSHTLDQLDICFDDTHAVANAACCWLPRWPSGSASSRPPMRRSTWASGLVRTGQAASC